MEVRTHGIMISLSEIGEEHNLTRTQLNSSSHLWSSKGSCFPWTKIHSSNT